MEKPERVPLFQAFFWEEMDLLSGMDEILSGNRQILSAIAHLLSGIQKYCPDPQKTHSHRFAVGETLDCVWENMNEIPSSVKYNGCNLK